MVRNDPYSAVTKDNFHIIREILLNAIGSKQPPTPNAIALEISDKAKIPVELARQIVNEELLMAFEWMKDRE